MNESTKQLHLANDLLRDVRTAALEERSLARALVALRRRRKQRQLLFWGIPATAIAASILAAAILVRAPTPPIMVKEHVPPPPAPVVQTTPPHTGITIHSRPTTGLVVNTRPAASGQIVRTDLSPSTVVIVNSERSGQIEFLTDRELLAAVAGRPVMLTETHQGERHLFFLDEP